MRNLILLFALAISCFGQGKRNVIETGTVDARGAVWLPPHATFASPPSLPPTGAVFLFTDASATGTCAGTGTALATCRWSGSAWQAVGGGGSVGSGSITCATGTVAAAAVAALSGTTGEITIQTGVAGTTRFDQVLVSETTIFAGSFTGLTVSMGRPGTSNHDEMTAGTVALMASSGDANFWSTRPAPPQITSGTYSIVLNFISTGANLSTASSGSLTWEVCSYAAR